MTQPNKTPPQHNNVFYYQHGKDALIEEIDPSKHLLSFLYTTKFGSIFRRLMTKKWVSKSLNWFYNCRASTWLIKGFVKEYHIDMTDYPRPLGSYKSFNDFFTRVIKPEARRINQNTQALISPADSKLYAIENISFNDTFFVKQKPFDLKTFLGDEALAKKFQNSAMLIFRLAPYDYHRFHFPCDCIPAAPKRINGILESVNPLVYKQNIQPLTTNERLLIPLESQEFGSVLMVPVGAMFVGKIVTTYTPAKAYKKGDEAGFFCFGGSTIVLLVKKTNFSVQKTFIEHTLQGFETEVKMGVVVNELVPPFQAGI